MSYYEPQDEKPRINILAWALALVIGALAWFGGWILWQLAWLGR